MRRELGRWGTLTATFLLAISPMFLYFSRFLREDIFVAFSTLALFVCLVRFVHRPQAVWWYTGMLSLAMLFCTKEVSFFYLALFGGFCLAWLCWQLAPRLLLILGGYAVLAAVVFFLVMWLYPPPAIPFDTVSATKFAITSGNLLIHPVFWSFIILSVVGIGIYFFAFREVASSRRQFMVSRGWASVRYFASASFVRALPAASHGCLRRGLAGPPPASIMDWPGTWVSPSTLFSLPGFSPIFPGFRRHF